MGMSEREHHIKVLKQFLHDYQEWGEDLELEKTIKYAISSLKTDEAYQIMYEGGEIFTKDEVIALLETLKHDISDKHLVVIKDWDDGYNCGLGASIGSINKVINGLRGEENENTNHL